MTTTYQENLRIFNETIMKNALTIPNCLSFIIIKDKTFKESFLINLNKIKMNGNIQDEYTSLIEMKNFDWGIFETVYGVNENKFLAELTQEEIDEINSLPEEEPISENPFDFM